MGFCKFTSRSLVGIAAVIFILFAGGLLALAITVLSSYGHIDKPFDKEYTVWPAIIMIVVAMFFALAAIVACCAMFNHNKCLLTVLAGILFLLLATLVLAAVVVYKAGPDVDKKIRDEAKKMLDEYGKDNDTRKEVDQIQEHWHCCGVSNYTDWKNTSWWSEEKAYPASCCQENCDDKPFADERKAYKDGCYEKIITVVNDNKTWITVGVGITIALLALMIIATLALCCIRRRNADELPYASLTT